LINMLVEIVLTTMPSSASRAWCVPRTIPIMCHKQTYDHVWKHFQIGSDEWASGVSHKGRLGRVRIYVCHKNLECHKKIDWRDQCGD
jgi:hypothetical protein